MVDVGQDQRSSSERQDEGAAAWELKKQCFWHEIKPVARRGACRSEYPGPTNTGAEPDLPNRPIKLTLTESGTVIEHVSLPGQVRIEGDHITLRDVTVESDGAYGVLVAGVGAVLEDVTIVGSPAGTMAGIAALDEGSFTARRVNVSNVEDGVRLGDDSKLLDSFIHGLRGGPGAHFDAVVAEGRRRWEVRNNTLANSHSQTSAVAIGLKARHGVVADNFISGGGYAIYAGPRTGSDLTVSGNVFSTYLQPRGGYWGPVAYWERPGNVWKGNVWADGQHAGKPVKP